MLGDIFNLYKRKKLNTILEINITTPEGRDISTNLKLTSEDLQLFSDLKEMAQQK